MPLASTSMPSFIISGALSMDAQPARNASASAASDKRIFFMVFSPASEVLGRKALQLDEHREVAVYSRKPEKLFQASLPVLSTAAALGAAASTAALPGWVAS